MRIMFDHQVFSLQAYGGISRYFVKLNEYLRQLGLETKIFAPLHKNQYLAGLSQDQYRGLGFRSFPPKCHCLVSAMNNFISERWVSSWTPDLIHETYYSSNSAKKIPTVITVYDMIHEIYPDNFSKNDKTSKNKIKSVRRADHIICISENTKRDLIDIFGVSNHKISVVYLGYDFLNRKNESLNFHKVNRRYLLYVGSRHGYKNFNSFLSAFSLSTYLRNNYIIVCFGGGSLTRNEYELIHSYGLNTDNVIHLDGEDTLLSSLYKTASVFVYPSLYEGFGLPLLEAMAHDCPVACSNASSIPEVVQSAGVFFDPHDPQSMCKAIESILLDDNLRCILINHGRERLKVFSWRKCAEETLDVYRKVLS